MRYAFFPGCSLHASAKECAMSANAVSKCLGIELVEIPEWNCCGSIDAVYAYNPFLSVSLSARNLAIAEKMGMDIVTLCSACFFTLSRASNILRENAEIKKRVAEVINDAGLKFEGGVKVRHYLDVLSNDVGVEEISRQVKVPLGGLRVAPYYGCLVVRPKVIQRFDDPEHPTSMDSVIEALGAEAVYYPDKTRCCGASLVITDESVMMEMAKGLLVTAKNMQADCLATLCPMCHLNLDAKQRDIESHFGVRFGLPVLYLTQLIGVAFGLDPKELGLNRNLVSPMKLLQKTKCG